MAWLDNLSGLIPGADSMSPEDKKALITQGLLALGGGILANNRGPASGAIGAGISQGLLALNNGADSIAKRKYQQQAMAQQAAGPSEFVAQDRLARAAGYEPGTPGYQEWMKRYNGEIARQSNAAYKYETVIGPDGVPRLVVADPRNPMASPLGANGAPQLPMPGAQNPAYTIDPSLPQPVQDAIRQSEATGQPLPQTFTPAPAIQRPSPTAGMNPFQGQTPQQKAYGEESGRQAAQLQALPTELGMRTNAALNTAQGQVNITNTAEIDQLNRKRARDAQNSIGLLDEADGLLDGATGSYAGALRDRAAATVGVSTSGAQHTASLKTIAGQLTSKMPRMEGPQSDKDVQLYKDMAGNLADDTLPVATRKAALHTIRLLQQKYASPQAQQPAADPLGIL